MVQLRLDTSFVSSNVSLGQFHLETESSYANPARANHTPEPEYVNFMSEAHRAHAIRECIDWDDVDALDRNESPRLIHDG